MKLRALIKFLKHPKRDDSEALTATSTATSTTRQPSRVVSALDRLQQRRRRHRRPSIEASGTVKEDDDDDDDTRMSEDEFDCQKNSGVRFMLSVTAYHEDTSRDLSSEEELNNCWYTADELKKFKVDQMLTAQSVFEDTFRLTPEQAERAQAWKKTIEKTYEACCTSSSFSSSSISEELHSVYSEGSDILVGLETSILARMRGKAALQRRAILQHLSVHSSLELLSSDGLSEGSSIRSTDSIISSITSPSSHFAHHVAMAQAKALETEASASLLGKK